MRPLLPALLLTVFCLALQPKTSAAQADLLQKIRDAGEIRVAINPGIRPMGFLRDGKLIGFDIDYGGALAQQLGVGVKWVQFEDLQDLTRLVESGNFQDRFDVVISAMGIDEERTARSVAVPYFKSGLTILTTNGQPAINTLESLVGKRVAAVSGSTEHGIVSGMDGVTVTDSPNYGESIELLKSGRVDATVLDVPVALLAAKDNPELRVVEPPFEEEWYGIYSEKEQKALSSEIRRIVKLLKSNGTFKRLDDKWF